MKIQQKVIETKSFGDTRRYVVGINPLSGKMFSYLSALPSVEGKDGSWTHAIGIDGCGFVNWDIDHKEGINPKHIEVDVFDVDYKALPDYNDSW